MTKAKCAAELEAAKARLFNCTSKKGFFQSLVTQLMPQLRRNAQIQISLWEARLRQDEIEKQQAYLELSQALSEIKYQLEIVKEQHRQGCPQQQEWRIEFGIEHKLICETIQKQHFILFEHILFNDSAPKQFLVKGQQVPHLDPYDEIIRDLCAENSIFFCKQSPCTRFYDRIRSLHIYCVPESNGIKFAPAALKLFEKEQLFLAMADLESAYSWLQLLWIEDAWVKAEEPGGCFNPIGWGPILKDDRMWANADAAYQKALQNHRANALWHFCHTNDKSAFLDLDRLKALINRLMLEVSRPILKTAALRQKICAATERYCVDKLVNYVLQLPLEELKKFQKARYKFEVFKLLCTFAQNDSSPYASHISPTMIAERVGPTANRILREKHQIIWRPPTGVQSPSKK